MHYRIIYCSRNQIEGSPQHVAAEIERILATSRRKNDGAGITGALIFNGQAFAQVLEGPREVVDQAYAAIRFDLRHSDVVTLEEAYQPERHFAGWTMAYSDVTSLRDVEGAEINLDGLQTNPDGFAAQILRLLQRVVNAPMPVVAARSADSSAEVKCWTDGTEPASGDGRSQAGSAIS